MSRRSLLLSYLANSFKWLPYSFEYLYYSLIPQTISGKQVRNKAKITKVYGNSVVENQLCFAGQFDSSSGWFTVGSSGTISVSNNIATITKTTSSTIYLYRANADYPTLTNHIYLHIANVKLSANGKARFTCGNAYQTGLNITANVWTKMVYLAQPTTFGGFFSAIDDTNSLSVNDTLECNFYEVIDLTQMFPFDTPTTLGDVRVQALLNRGYIEYNTGEIKDSEIGEIESEPYNLLNLDRTKGTLSGYVKTTPRDFDYSKYYVGMSRDGYYDESNITNYEISNGVVKIQTRQSGYGIVFPIKVLPNTSYTLSATTISDTSGYNTGLGVGYYDENGLNIGYTQAENAQTNKSVSFITPNNCVEITVVLYTNQNINLTTYSNICFHRTGTRTDYAPHIQPQTLPFIYQGNGAGTSHDTFEITSSEYVFTKNIGSYTITENQGFNIGGITSQDLYCYYFNISTMSVGSGQDGICDKYPTDKGAYNAATIPSVRFGQSNSAIYVYLTENYTTSSEVANKMKGVNLLYPLATPQVIRIPKKHLGIVDLGNATFKTGRVDGTTDDGRFHIDNFISDAVVGHAGTTPNIYVSKYKTVSSSGAPLSEDKTISLEPQTTTIYLRDTNYTNVNDIKAALSGVYLFYETESEVADTETQIDIEAGGAITTNWFSWVENQLVQNGNFADASGWYTTGTTSNITVSNNVALITKTTTSILSLYRTSSSFTTFVINHKYLAVATIKPSANGTFRFRSGNVNEDIVNINANVKTTLAQILLPTATSTFVCVLEDNSSLSVGDTLEVSNYMFIDLTLAFGSGKEPASVNDPKLQKIISQGYIPTNTTGTQKSFDSEVLPNLSIKLQAK